jgi:hypothetical protein
MQRQRRQVHVLRFVRGIKWEEDNTTWAAEDGRTRNSRADPPSRSYTVRRNVAISVSTSQVYAQVSPRDSLLPHTHTHTHTHTHLAVAEVECAIKAAAHASRNHVREEKVGKAGDGAALCADPQLHEAAEHKHAQLLRLWVRHLAALRRFVR